MQNLDSMPTLADLQKYVIELERERGFEKQDVVQKCLLLGEEVGELFKAIRKSTGMAMDPQSRVGTAADELADILIYLCAIANRMEIDLEEAFRAKEEKNMLRKWEDGSGSRLVESVSLPSTTN